MQPSVAVLNGPNLNLLGRREPAVYGSVTLEDIEALCRDHATTRGLTIDFRQSNHEGALIDWIHEAGDRHRAIVINAGAYTHTSLALHDALRAAALPVVEVHLSNVFRREAVRHQSWISPVAVGVISGFGAQSYVLALDAVAQLLTSVEN